MGFRLHIDIPIDGMTVEDAQRIATETLTTLGLSIANPKTELMGSGLVVNYRLGHDDDRQRSNYLDMDARGHCSHRKSSIKFGRD
jgi:hypothetical protein